ncbi:MAG: hypothetical protein WC758_05970 [Candidatus Woesearchaeota archaeon]|jgi:hypothetical protein
MTKKTNINNTTIQQNNQPYSIQNSPKNTYDDITLKNSINELVDELFSFVKNNNINDDTSLPKMREYIKENYHEKLLSYSESELEIFIEKIKHENFYNDALYNCKTPSNLYSFMNSLDSFRCEMIYYIEGRISKKERPHHKLVRMISPPIEAYEYIGHSKIDIKPTGRDFGLLFE